MKIVTCAYCAVDKSNEGPVMQLIVPEKDGKFQKKSDRYVILECPKCKFQTAWSPRNDR